MREETASLERGQEQAVLVRTVEQLHATRRARHLGVPTTQVQVSIPTPTRSARRTGHKARVHEEEENLAEARGLTRVAGDPNN